MPITTLEALNIAQIVREFQKDELAELIKEEIWTSDIKQFAVMYQVSYATAALAEYLIAKLNATISDDSHLPIDPTWTRLTITALDCKKSSTGNITWLAEFLNPTTRKLYIRQQNKQLFLDAGYADLEKMKIGDFATCNIVVYVLPDGDSFYKPMHVVSGGTITLPAPFTDPFADVTPSPLVGEGAGGEGKLAGEVTSLPATPSQGSLGDGERLSGLWVKATDTSKTEVIRRARDLLARGTDLLVGDTETTGAQMDDHPVSLAFVNIHEDVVLDLRCCPPHPEFLLRPGKNGKTASDINGFTPDQVRQFPPVADIKEDVKLALYRKSLVTYNLEFDLRMLDKVSDGQATSTGAACLMLMYAQYRGKPNQYGKPGYEWVSLSVACEDMKIPTADLHHALGDSILALRLLKALAAVEIVD